MIEFTKIPTAEVFLVGGAVRDSLLGLTARERDWLVVGSNPKKMLELGYRQVGNDFPVFLHPKTHEEHALARRERKLETGHRGFQTDTGNVTLEEDLSRRDLTINAIAQSESGQIIDPYNGRADLENRTLRHVSSAFCEDPLRVLRVARFAAQLAPFDFRVAPGTLELLKSMSSNGELASLVPERVWRETERALKSPRPRVFFEVLRSADALKIIFPELDALFGVPQRPEFHPEIDSGLHTMLSLDRITESTLNSRLRFAVLVHDLGKATTPPEILPRHTRHEDRSARITEALCDRLRIPNAYREIAVLVARHHLLCHTSMRLRASTIEKLLSSLNAWKDSSLVADFTECCKADAQGRTGLESRPYPQVEFLSECADAAKMASAEKLIAKGFKGERLGNQLKAERAKLIKLVIARYSHIDELQYVKAADPGQGS